MRRGASVLFVLCVALIALASCAQENAPPGLGAPLATGPDASVPGPTGPRVCEQTHAESLPARLVAMSAHASSGSNVVLVSDLFQQFVNVCGACHGPNLDEGQGGFQVTDVPSFTQTDWATDILHVTMAVCPATEDPKNPFDPMPPCGGTGRTYTTRSTTTDPVYLFAQGVLEWLAAGKTASFTPGATSAPGGDAGGDAGAPVSNFVLTPQDGNAMTNIGNCVPSPALMGLQADKMAALDRQFAAAQPQATGNGAQILGLPEHLSETDLVSFDSATLAQTGVIAYAPGYPLWTDNAGKLRHVRVPQGQSIHFNKATQEFEIPPNTRFYKTFMKQVIDTDGSYRYAKIETRVIVARPDQNNPDGTAAAQTALFGTYHWRPQEDDADLIETPLNNELPFSDTVLLYNTDEPLAADLLKAEPLQPDVALIQGGAARHYAIPSSARCVQCHMGSPSQSFVLGFTPLQINRRLPGVGGVIEATGPDELTQLQRFIDAGVITGIQSLADVLPLEQSQGTRAPRNDYELVAQGYSLGNCAHCHNPRGFPTVQNPVLQGVLDMLPSAEGGIFQFPLERFSPRIGRGSSGTEPIPYITPSLVDLPRVDAAGNPQTDIFVHGDGAGGAHSVIFAPWRSIIYRNVDAAFAYVDDLALYPHMPMNSPGYDPRAKQIMADWMVSIPAIRKRPDLLEYAYQTGNNGLAANIPPNAVPDPSYQPYVEVLPGTPDYEAAQVAANQRLSVLHTGVNPAVPSDSTFIPYSRWADLGQTGDILDPQVIENPVCNPVPAGNPSVYNGYPFPEHPHWVTTDLTDPPPPWAPRQPNWPDAIGHGNILPLGTACSQPAALLRAHDDEVIVVSLLPSMTIGQVCDFVTTPRPFGLWQQQSGCDFSSQKKVQDFTGAARPHWMDVVNAPPTAPVYQQTPGEAIFKMICINCHGPRADAAGRLAQNLATMTGGGALVANFRTGLFGPVGATGTATNIHAQFGTAQLTPDELTNPDWTGSVTDDDRAARYLAWMGLGGTSVNIPLELLQIVAVTKVLDQQRNLASGSLSANMLSQAKALCQGLLGPGAVEFGNATGGRPAPTFNPGAGHGYLDAVSTNLNEALIPQNGDLELWLGLCSRDNPPPVHVLKMADKDGLTFKFTSVDDLDGTFDLESLSPDAMVTPDTYPPGTPVGNERGGTDPSLCVDAATCCPQNPASCTLCTLPGQANCQTQNEWPWCIDPSTVVGPSQIAWVKTNNWPLCPKAVTNVSSECVATHGPGCVSTDYANQWALRGAIHAGLAVFTYVKSIENTTPPPDFNECSALSTPATPPSFNCAAP